jgi:chemotaxis protein MotB
MNPRILLVLPLAAAMALSGCRTRVGAQQEVLTSEQSSELARINSENERLQKENLELQRQRDALAGGTAANTNGATLGDILKQGEIEGMSGTGRGGIALDDDFAFAKGSADLNDAGKKSLGQLASKLNGGDYATAQITVEGHTDDTPVSRASNKEKYGDNWGLSAARAATVVRALEKAGIAADRLHGAFRGEHSPRGSDKAANRRVELYVK